MILISGLNVTSTPRWRTILFGAALRVLQSRELMPNEKENR